jgi:hypothetical protein
MSDRIAPDPIDLGLPPRRDPVLVTMRIPGSAGPERLGSFDADASAVLQRLMAAGVAVECPGYLLRFLVVVEGAEDRDAAVAAAVRLVEDAAGGYLAVDSAQHGSLPVL